VVPGSGQQAGTVARLSSAAWVKRPLLGCALPGLDGMAGNRPAIVNDVTQGRVHRRQTRAGDSYNQLLCFKRIRRLAER